MERRVLVQGTMCPRTYYSRRHMCLGSENGSDRCSLSNTLPSARISVLPYLYEVNNGITKKKRRRGRPPTGRDPVLAVRLPNELRASVERWAKNNGVTRSEAIRVLIDKGLR